MARAPDYRVRRGTAEATETVLKVINAARGYPSQDIAARVLAVALAGHGLHPGDTQVRPRVLRNDSGRYVPVVWLGACHVELGGSINARGVVVVAAIGSLH